VIEQESQMTFESLIAPFVGPLHGPGRQGGQPAQSRYQRYSGSSTRR
jgi:hypothetical protein